jgi:hypothetical protein
MCVEQSKIQDEYGEDSAFHRRVYENRIKNYEERRNSAPGIVLTTLMDPNVEKQTTEVKDPDSSIGSVSTTSKNKSEPRTNPLERFITKLKITQHKLFETVGLPNPDSQFNKIDERVSRKADLFQKRCDIMNSLVEIIEKQSLELQSLHQVEAGFSLQISQMAVKEMGSLRDHMMNIGNIYRSIPTQKLCGSCTEFHHYMDTVVNTVAKDVEMSYEKVDDLRLECIGTQKPKWDPFPHRSESSMTPGDYAMQRYNKAIEDYLEKMDFTMKMIEIDFEKALITYIASLRSYFKSTYKIIRANKYK